jgi:hypothetical protein
LCGDFLALMKLHFFSQELQALACDNQANGHGKSRAGIRVYERWNIT